jgi:HPt (histidine-containing phosphotransfer) domain-containing protein
MEQDQERLTEAALRLIAREREVLALRMKQDQTAAWLTVTQSLPKHFSLTASAQDTWANVARSVISALKYQRVAFYSFGVDVLKPLDKPNKPELVLDAEVQSFLERNPMGLCNAPDSAGVGALAGCLSLHRFMWSRIEMPVGRPVLMVAGFDRDRSAFHLPLEESDGAHFRNFGQQLEILLRNRLLLLDVQESNRKLEALNATLEQKVEERTKELLHRNRDMRLVLDNVAQGFLTIDAHGVLAQERSAIVDRWFGPYTGPITFADYTGAFDREFGERFGLGYEAYREGFLPRKLCLDQLPTQLRLSGRTFQCSYTPLDDGAQEGGLLIVVSDITEQLVSVQRDAEQRDVMALVQGLMRDRSGYLGFVEEANRIVEQTRGPIADLARLRLLLHTLKGNAGAVNLHVLANLCHEAEEEIEETQTAPEQPSIAKIWRHWQTLHDTVTALLGAREAGTVEVQTAELDRICRELREGAPLDVVLESLVYARLEPAERALGRLEKYTRELGHRLRKGDVEVRVDGHGVRVDPQTWAPLWSDVIHLVRNAVDHGFETPDERRLAGKATPPCLRLETVVTQGRLVLQLSDDGRGIDWPEVSRCAQDRGLPHASESDLLTALFSPAFTTRRNVTGTSGRGMGLSAVLERVQAMNGTITVESRTGQGSSWRLSLPTASSGHETAMSRPELVPRARAAGALSAR